MFSGFEFRSVYVLDVRKWGNVINVKIHALAVCGRIEYGAYESFMQNRWK